MATALPYFLADDATAHLTAFVTLKLDPGAADGVLSDFPAAADWVGTLQAGSWELVTDATAAPLPLTVVPDPDARPTPARGPRPFRRRRRSPGSRRRRSPTRRGTATPRTGSATGRSTCTWPPSPPLPRRRPACSATRRCPWRARPDVAGLRHRAGAAPDGRGARRPGRGAPAAAHRRGGGEHRHAPRPAGRRVCVQRRRPALADRGAARRRGPRRPGHPAARRRAGPGPHAATR